MKTHDIIVIGASSGGIEALIEMVASFSVDLPAAIFVVLHIPVQADDLLPSVLQRGSVLPIHTAADGERIVRSRIYVAPPDRHLMIGKGHVELTRGPKENRHRPAIDALFRSAAKSYGPRVAGVILSGHLDDGTIGLNSIKVHGGVTIVQSPEEAVAPGMIRHALQNVEIDHILPLAQIGPLLVRLAANSIPHAGKNHLRLLEDPEGIQETTRALGAPTPYICPECHGPLWEQKIGDTSEFRCHVGHIYSNESLLVDQDDDLERALWSAVRIFDEQANLLRRLMKRNVEGALLARWEKRAKHNEKNADALRVLLHARRSPLAG
jgi:two-component system chemotaxis response regulator CheB